MDNKDLLTVKEFAAIAGKTTQRIYQLTQTTLKDYVTKSPTGGVMLHKDGLKLVTYQDLPSDFANLQGNLQILQTAQSDNNEPLLNDNAEKSQNDLPSDLQNLQTAAQEAPNMASSSEKSPKTEDQSLQMILEAHQETVAALKAQIDDLKEDKQQLTDELSREREHARELADKLAEITAREQGLHAGTLLTDKQQAQDQGVVVVDQEEQQGSEAERSAPASEDEAPQQPEKKKNIFQRFGDWLAREK